MVWTTVRLLLLDDPMNRSEDLPFETRRAQTEGNMRGNHVPHDCTVPVRIGKFLSFRSAVDLADLQLETCSSGCIHPNFDPSASDTLTEVHERGQDFGSAETYVAATTVKLYVPLGLRVAMRE